MKPEHRITLFPPSADVLAAQFRTPTRDETEAWLHIHLAKWSLINRVQYEDARMTIRTNTDQICIDFRFPMTQFHVSMDEERPQLVLFFEGFAVKQRPAKAASEANTLFDDHLVIRMATDVSEQDMKRLGRAFQTLSNHWATTSLGNTALFGT